MKFDDLGVKIQTMDMHGPLEYERIVVFNYLDRNTIRLSINFPAGKPITVGALKKALKDLERNSMSAMMLGPQEK